MKKPSKLVAALADKASPQPLWETIGEVLHVTFLDAERGVTVVMRSREEWVGKTVDELRRLVPVSRRTLGTVWLVENGTWRKL